MVFQDRQDLEWHNSAVGHDLSLGVAPHKKQSGKPVRPVGRRVLRDMRKGESSADVRNRVEAARARQRKRFEGIDMASNADMRPRQIRKYCALDDPCQALMKTAMRQLQLTARAYHRVLKLSRTIADLEGSEAITHAHLAEALQYRHKLELM